MPLPFKVKDLEKVPESARGLYEKKGDEYVLQVEGAKGEDEISGLSTALERQKKELKELREKAGRFSDDDLTELEELRKERREREATKAKEEGRWEDLRAKNDADWQKKLDAKETELSQERERGSKRNREVIRAALLSGISSTVKPEYHKAVQALLTTEHQFDVEWTDEGMQVVVLDEVRGNKPVSAFIGEWAKTDSAKPYLPVPTKSGGGAPGTEGKPGSGKSWEGKKYGEMNPDEKKEYLAETYGEKQTA